MRRPASFRVAAVQACPVYLDLERTIDKACLLIAEAAGGKADLVVFPEAFVPGYPIPSRATERLCEAAHQAGAAVAIGVNEKNIEASGASLFNTLLYIGPDAALLGKHRKLVPTGDYMPLARYALAAWGAQTHVAPTWDRGEPWLSTLRHVAKEGRAVTIGCCQAVRKDDIPDDLAFKSKYLADVGGWINPGGSVIVDPDGKILAGPAMEAESILYADVQGDQLVGPRWQLDIAGHYARPDVFELIVHRRPTPLIREVAVPRGTKKRSQRRRSR